jgi:hypothetical protein
MKIVEGDRFREKSSGQVFSVRRIEDNAVIMEAEDRPNRFLIGDGILDLLFDRVESQRGSS